APTTADPTLAQPPEPAPRIHELAVDPPDAQVLVDGRPATTASPHPIALPQEGPVVVEVRKAGYEPRRFELDASSEPPARVVLAKAKPKDPGFLRVTAPSVPWAEVSLDGRRIATTPTRKLTVPSGRHRIKVRC